MKSIAILTDFSRRAENAANYALHLAQSLRSNLILYDSFLVPSANPMANQIAWPFEGYNKLHKDGEKELQLFSGKLRKILSLQKETQFKPDISYRRHDGNLSVDMEELPANKDLVLLVMASHDKSIASLLLGDHVRKLLDAAALPLLIIRDQHIFRKINNIAFSTNLDISDIEVIRSLASMAKPTNAQITLIHISQADTDEKVVAEFMTMAMNKINYPHIIYRKMAGRHIMDEITGLDENNTYDMLALVLRHKGFWEKLFNDSGTQKMATQISLPLLLYPYPFISLPDFYNHTNH